MTFVRKFGKTFEWQITTFVSRLALTKEHLGNLVVEATGSYETCQERRANCDRCDISGSRGLPSSDNDNRYSDGVKE
jgi:hypothetical protein